LCGSGDGGSDSDSSSSSDGGDGSSGNGNSVGGDGNGGVHGVVMVLLWKLKNDFLQKKNGIFFWPNTQFLFTHIFHSLPNKPIKSFSEFSNTLYI